MIIIMNERHFLIGKGFLLFFTANLCNLWQRKTLRKRMKELPDKELIDKILSGGRKYFEEIYERYAIKIYQKCLSFTKDESEAKDVAHDIIVKIYLNLAKFNKKSKFSTWIYSITYNHCVDHQAKKKRQLSLREEIIKENEDIQINSPTDEEVLSLNIESLHALLEKLTPAEKSILLMKYQDGFSIKDIAEHTGSGESAVKMKLKRTKAKLMKLYEEGE